ncbi:MAG: hypothetical protein IKJ29_08935 [Akkermansia sp.]|nr:hypothetical protein [Akkermansia sp.]
MGRRKPDPVMQKLRTLARSGRRSEAAELLSETLRQNPGHAKAREELSRHLTGRPFTFEEKDYEELQKIISDFLASPQMVGSMKKSAIKRLRKRVRYLQTAQEHMLTAMEKKLLQQFRSNMNRELQRRRKPMGKLAIAALALVLVLLILAATVFFLWKRSCQAASILNTAQKEKVTRSVARSLLTIHDTGLNRSLNRRVGHEAEQLRAYIRAADRRAAELDALLGSIESGKQSVVGQGVSRRAEVERKLRELGSDAADLQIRWATLCQAEKDALNMQRLSLAEELMAPLPPGQQLQGSPEKDIAILQQRKKTLLQRIHIYEDAGDALKLPEGLISPVKKELKLVESRLKEASSMKHLLKMLPTAHEYENYRKLLAGLTPQHYAPAAEMLSIRDKLPALDNLQSMMQEHGQNLKPGLLQAAKNSLVDGKPSFSVEFPATKEQLHLLNELLTNSALSTRLYELTDTAENQHAYSERLPELRHGRACFDRSSLDPDRDINKRKEEEWHTPHAILSRELDPRPLYQKLGFSNRTGFHTTVNLPHLLTEIFRIEGNTIPPLARAYVFDYLVRANAAASDPLLTGLRYAPRMRQLIDEFNALKKACGIRIDGDCWLYASPYHNAAETKFARWFHKNRKVSFKDELKKNLNELLRVAPRFCGYIDENGEAVLFEETRKDQLLWYLSREEAMTATAVGMPLQHPRPLSPVFTMEKRP